MPITGKNGKRLVKEIQNVAAAHINIGQWTDDAVHTHGGRLAKRLSFWLERRPDERSFWTPTMTLSNEFFDTIQTHRVPIDTDHLAQFARSPRRMDLYVWLSYRTPRIAPAKGTTHFTTGAVANIRARHHAIRPLQEPTEGGSNSHRQRVSPLQHPHRQRHGHRLATTIPAARPLRPPVFWLPTHLGGRQLKAQINDRGGVFFCDKTHRQVCSSVTGVCSSVTPNPLSAPYSIGLTTFSPVSRIPLIDFLIAYKNLSSLGTHRALKKPV